MNAFLSTSTTIEIEDVGTVLLERSLKAKRLIITVKPFKGVRVAVPKGVSFSKAEQIARNKSEWMKKHLGKMREFEKLCENANRVTVDREEAKKILVARLKEMSHQHGYKYNRVTIRNQKTRWGSCSGKNHISLNMKLILLPDELRDYIILHELVHTKIKNHGKKYWEELLRIEPKAKELDKQMNQYPIRLL